jgi:transcriptional regulator with XRE-family HTH domain
MKRELGILRARKGFRIREVLDKRGWTLTALAKDMGLSVNAISKVINGHSHSERILDRLRLELVPEKYLFDPRRYVAQDKDSKKGSSAVQTGKSPKS